MTYTFARGRPGLGPPRRTTRKGRRAMDQERDEQLETIRRRIWIASIWCWPICVVGFGVFFALVAGFVPPPRENWSAVRIAEFYADNRTAIRIGLIGAMFFSALMLPFFTVLSAEIKKAEGRLGLLAPIQFGGAVM